MHSVDLWPTLASSAIRWWTQNARLDFERTRSSTVEDMTGEEGLTIAQMARATGISEHTLRYYERVGLIPAVERTAGDQRRYRDADIEGVRFLLRLRQTGMRIAKMREYARLRFEGESTLEARMALLKEHEIEVSARIGQLERNRQALEQKISIYQSLIAQKPSTTHQEKQ